jgi:biopolymer transport protein TolR
MAASSTRSDETISGINVTPLVDVVLVLLVVLMVTATYIASRAIPVDLPRGATGEVMNVPLAVTLDRDGRLFLDAVPVTTEKLRFAIRAAQRTQKDLRAVIAADGSVSHRQVVNVIDLLRQENVVHFAINVNPGDLDGSTKK